MLSYEQLKNIILKYNLELSIKLLFDIKSVILIKY